MSPAVRSRNVAQPYQSSVVVTATMQHHRPAATLRPCRRTSSPTAGSARRRAASSSPSTATGCCGSGATTSTRCRAGTRARRAAACPPGTTARRRLDRPRLRGVDVVVGRARSPTSRARSTASSTPIGPDAVALYLATGLAYDAAGQIAASQWLPSIGSRSFLTAVTVDNAPVLVAAELVSGEPMLNPVWDPTARGRRRSSSAPTRSCPTATAPRSPIRSAASASTAPAAGGCGCSTRAAPRPPRSPTRTSRSGRAPTSPCSARSRARAARGRRRRTRAARPLRRRRGRRAAGRARRVHRSNARRGVADVDPDALDRARRRRARRARARRDALRHRRHDGARRRSSPSGCAGWSSSRPARSTGPAAACSSTAASCNDSGGGTAPRPAAAAGRRASRPELPRVLGQVPAVALADEIEAGNIRALVVTGGNPLTAFPQPDRLRAALARLDVLAVVDVAENALTALATHVLPATGQLERADITLAELTALRGGLQATGPVVPAGRRPAAGVVDVRRARARRWAGPRSAASTPTCSPTSTTCAACSGTRRSTPTPCSRPARAGSSSTTSPAGCTHDLLPDGRWSIAPGATRSSGSPRTAIRSRRAFVLAPATRDGVEQLGRVRRATDVDPGARASRRDRRPTRGTPRRSRPRTGRVTATVGRRPHGARRRGLDDPRPRRDEPGRPHERRRRRRPAHRDAAGRRPPGRARGRPTADAA